MATNPTQCDQGTPDALERLFRGAIADLHLPEPAIWAMAAHWRLVKTWQARVNLTAITDDTEAAWLHYRDSLEALQVIPDGCLADMGSGAGFPGIPIAAAQPWRPVTLVEPRRKRASFLETVAARLCLENVHVLQARSADPPDRQYNAVVTRATFSGDADLRRCLDWLVPGGVLVAFRADMNAPPPGAELHRYTVSHHSRALVIWRRGGSV